MQLPVHNQAGDQVDTLQVDEQLLGGEVRPDLLKQAYVRYHANRRQGTAKTKTRGEVSGSRQKLYRQKGTGNARRGDKKANILIGGGRAHGPRPHSWRKKMPRKMRRLANRNALLAKLVDDEIKLVDGLNFETPSTRRFASLVQSLGIDHRCLLALDDTRGHTARSARNIDDITVTQIDRLNAFDLLNHRYLLVDRAAFENYLERLRQWATEGKPATQEAA
jgi:large subunit ribosomal protein L4